jgi:hypothetical protein
MADINRDIVDAISTLKQKDLIVHPFPEVSPFPGGYKIAKP